ncbi:MAG: alginate export family protein [Verrucomicrobiae bacterium]|nr:alginate export family protein [Verrucomicrobiae bacterium]
MNTKRRAVSCLGSFLLAVSPLAASGQDSAPAVQTNPGISATAPAAKTPNKSAGLLNDWLCEQSPTFNAWDVGGELRVRYEVKDNAGSWPDRDFIRRGQDNDNDYLLLRQRVHVGYTPESWVNVYVEGRNATAEYDKRNPSPERDEMDLHQAYIALGDARQFPLLFKAGRQELLYGDQRFVGVSDWGNLRRAFDAAKLRFENEDFWVDAFMGRVVMPDDERFNVDNDHDWFSGLYASSQKPLLWQETQLFFLSRNVGARSADVVTTTGKGAGARDVYTIGTRWKSLPGKLGGWDYGVEVAGQLGSVSLTNPGEDQTAMRHDLKAFGVFVSGGYTWTNVWSSPRLSAGFDYGTGDEDASDKDTQTFQNLFGTLHGVYGQMDLFGARNMQIPRVSFSFKPAKGLTIAVDYLMFWMADTHDYLYPESAGGRDENGYGIHPKYDSFVGSELDVVVTYALKTFGDVQAGYGRYFVGDYIKQSVGSVAGNGGAVDANWFYVQARFNF